MWVEELMGNLNCLVYSGALVARKLGEEEEEDKETDVVMAEGRDGVLDPDEMEVERALGVEQDPRGGGTPNHQVIGWLESEIQRRKSRLSLKKGLRLKKLQKQLGGN